MLTFEEGRVLGAMIEKAMTTPDHYPMSLHAVVTACNQVSNREPVVTFEEGRVELILRGLADRGLAKMVHRPGDRVVKYRHALDADLEVDQQQVALIAVLLLRGEQTPGELRQRTQRYVEFTSLPEVEATLEGLRSRETPLVGRQDRRPGEREHRYRHLLSGPDDAGSPRPGGVLEGGDADVEVAAPRRQPDEGLREDVDALRAEVAELARRLDRVMDELGIR
jgi:uncharacterized protein YceH (UPF0502 family)